MTTTVSASTTIDAAATAAALSIDPSDLAVTAGALPNTSGATVQDPGTNHCTWQSSSFPAARPPLLNLSPTATLKNTDRVRCCGAGETITVTVPAADQFGNLWTTGNPDFLLYCPACSASSTAIADDGQNVFTFHFEGVGTRTAQVWPPASQLRRPLLRAPTVPSRTLCHQHWQPTCRLRVGRSCETTSWRWHAHRGAP